MELTCEQAEEMKANLRELLEVIEALEEKGVYIVSKEDVQKQEAA